MRMDKPKAAPLVGIVLTCLSALLIVGLLTFAGPCEVAGGATARSCVWACRAMLGMGAVLAILSIVRIFETDEGERRGLSLGAALVGALIAATPGFIIELCADPTLHCNAVMRPFAMAVGALVFLVGAIDLVRRLLAIGKE